MVSEMPRPPPPHSKFIGGSHANRLAVTASGITKPGWRVGVMAVETSVSKLRATLLEVIGHHAVILQILNNVLYHALSSCRTRLFPAERSTLVITTWMAT
jgi:hypothetical protein